MSNPLCIINYDNKALLLYDNLPCHNNRIFSALNLSTEKSEAKAAYLPSFPSIPIPTSADYIIPTSLPPSPIVATTNPEYFFNNSVITVFWVGEHLQQITDGQFIAAFIKVYSNPLSASYKLVPSITKTLLELASKFYNINDI
jgi:hypothetical protein